MAVSEWDKQYLSEDEQKKIADKLSNITKDKKE